MHITMIGTGFVYSLRVHAFSDFGHDLMQK
jgi:UDP-glucose 6-dehydrogenase